MGLHRLQRKRIHNKAQHILGESTQRSTLAGRKLRSDLCISKPGPWKNEFTCRVTAEIGCQFSVAQSTVVFTAQSKLQSSLSHLNKRVIQYL